MQRHEILRTGYRLEAGQPTQVVLPAGSGFFSEVDLQHLPAGDREAAWREAALHTASEPFDLAAGRVFRVRLWRLSPEEHVLVLCEHHIAADAWSTSILFREIGILYRAMLSGLPSGLADLALQYGDFALWQAGELRRSTLPAQLDYWRHRLDPFPATSPLPPDHPRGDRPTFRGAYAEFQVPAGPRSQLHRIAHDHGATLYMVLLAAFTALLHHRSHTDDIVVGTPVAGRPRPELESLIGFFLNTLVMRTSTSGNPSFLELLDRVKETAMGAYANQEAPIELVLEGANRPGGGTTPPFPHVMLVLQNAPIEPLDLPGMEISLLEIPIESSKHDLTFGMWERGAILQGWIEYNTDLFDASTMEELASDWNQLLVRVGNDPTLRLDKLAPGGTPRLARAG